MTRPKADKIIDARRMEPPEPLVQTMEALDALAPGQKVLLILGREPTPLYRVLELNGYSWETERTSEGTVEVLMWHKAN